MAHIRTSNGATLRFFFFLPLIGLGFFPIHAKARESRLSMDPAANLSELAKLEDLSKLPITVTREGPLYLLDASAVVHCDLERLYRVSTEYDRYVEFGMPDLKANLIVERGPGDLLFTWSHMTTLGQSSKHYLEIHLAPQVVVADARGLEWQQVRRREPWAQEDQPGFSEFFGSWYMQDMRSSFGEGAVYVRYFLAAAVRPGLSPALVDLFMKGKLKVSVRQVIRTLSAQANRP